MTDATVKNTFDIVTFDINISNTLSVLNKNTKLSRAFMQHTFIPNIQTCLVN
jgi:hypothetical protein